MIVPPLTLNFIEHILLAKDKLFKKTKNLGNEPLVFTDDGFAIGIFLFLFYKKFVLCTHYYVIKGIAYTLKLLDQNKEFDSLHWFESVIKRYEEEQQSVLAANKSKSKEDQQTTQLTLKKLRTQMMEFELLKYPFPKDLLLSDCV